MIQRLSERPPIGAWILDDNNPWKELERLQCVGHMDDVDDPDIKYALFASEDESKNDKMQDGIKYYTLRGYTDLHDGR